MQKLGAGDLREADCRHIARVAIKTLVHLLIDALRLERNLIEMGTTKHVLFAMQALAGPLGTILELSTEILSRGLPASGHRRSPAALYGA